MESNKLIAEFMGGILSSVPNLINLPQTIGESRILCVKGSEGLPNGTYEVKRITDLKYHSSWDWLMPVVEKIESLRNGSGDAYRFNIDMCNVDIENTEINITSTHKIKAIHQAVVEFITTPRVRIKEDIITRLKFWDSGDGVDFEYWRDTETEFVYQVPIEIVRDFNEIKKVNVG